MRTAKYTLLTFLPRNLFEQFHRGANLYFAFIIMLNWLPIIEAFNRPVAMLPLLVVLTVTAIKDAWENYRRYRCDREVNARPWCGVSVVETAKGALTRRPRQPGDAG